MQPLCLQQQVNFVVCDVSSGIIGFISACVTSRDLCIAAGGERLLPFALLANCLERASHHKIIIRDTKLPKLGSKLCRDPSPVLARANIYRCQGKRDTLYIYERGGGRAPHQKQLVKY
jgi:hypothetical protein